MKLIVEYLYSHIKILILLILFTLIFAVVFRLYGIPVEPVLYAALLCVVVGLTAFIAAFLIFQKKHKALIELKKNITVSIDTLPDHKRVIEKDYRSCSEYCLTTEDSRRL